MPPERARSPRKKASKSQKESCGMYFDISEPVGTLGCADANMRCRRLGCPHAVEAMTESSHVHIPKGVTRAQMAKTLVDAAPIKACPPGLLEPNDQRVQMPLDELPGELVRSLVRFILEPDLDEAPPTPRRRKGHVVD